MRAPGRTLGERFDSAPNALNLLRLILAIEVVVWHSYSLRGSTWLPQPVEAFLGDIAVDAFFAISGFLIVGAWCRRPQLGVFLAARARRILPGLWVCLVVTAFVVAPLVAWATGTPQPTLAGQWHYVIANADVWVSAYGIDGGPVGVPEAGSWNGSLWTLGYEGAAYLAVAALGFTRLLRPRVVWGLAITFWVLSAALVVAGLGASGLPLWCAPRTGLMFTSGALLWLYRDRIPLTRLLLAVAALTIPIGLLTPNYRLLAAPAIAYLCLAAGLALGRYPRLVLRTDLSYGVYVYGFVVQQALLACGVSLGWAPFTMLSLVVVLPVAAASWFLVSTPRPGAADPRPGAHRPGRISSTGNPTAPMRPAGCPRPPDPQRQRLSREETTRGRHRPRRGIARRPSPQG